VHAFVSFGHLLCVHVEQSVTADGAVEPVASARHSVTQCCCAHASTAAKSADDAPPSHEPASDAPHRQSAEACWLLTALHEAHPPSHVGRGAGVTV
jgi:hypothetical protein